MVMKCSSMNHWWINTMKTVKNTHIVYNLKRSTAKLVYLVYETKSAQFMHLKKGSKSTVCFLLLINILVWSNFNIRLLHHIYVFSKKVFSIQRCLLLNIVMVFFCLEYSKHYLFTKQVNSVYWILRIWYR